ncbi:MAG: hypothetical protein KDB87_16095, partial [Flavobacteriales bacterium]|nr:hypothetical protein [Flavobacteriales bacterium]
PSLSADTANGPPKAVVKAPANGSQAQLERTGVGAFSWWSQRSSATALEEIDGNSWKRSF